MTLVWTIDFKLKRYDPVGSTGVEPYTNPGAFGLPCPWSLNEASPH